MNGGYRQRHDLDAVLLVRGLHLVDLDELLNEGALAFADSPHDATAVAVQLTFSVHALLHPDVGRHDLLTRLDVQVDGVPDHHPDPDLLRLSTQLKLCERTW